VYIFIYDFTLDYQIYIQCTFQNKMRQQQKRGFLKYRYIN